MAQASSSNVDKGIESLICPTDNQDNFDQNISNYDKASVQGSFPSLAHQDDHDTGSRITSSSSYAKKLKYAQTHQKNRVSAFGPFLGFEDFNNASATTVPVRTTLDLDTRFFPSGLKPGHIVEVKGPENSGKTFLLTYFLAQLVTRYPEKTAVIIDTSHKFNIRNLVSIISHLDPDIKINNQDSSQALSQVLENNPKLASYLDRIIVIKCNTVEEYIFTIWPEKKSIIDQMIENDSNLSLIAIDSVDNYSFTESADKKDPKKFPNVMELIAKAVRSTRTPVICTTIMRVEHYEKLNMEAEEIRMKSLAGPEDDEKSKSWYSNIVIEAKYFTHSILIVPVTQAEKEVIPRPLEFKYAHYASAYLRSRHKANMAGSVANHRVKFSIFSDMLWVDESGAGPKP